MIPMLSSRLTAYEKWNQRAQSDPWLQINIAFLGAQDETMTTIRLDSGPAAAKLLKEDAVDVVLLTPV